MLNPGPDAGRREHSVIGGNCGGAMSTCMRDESISLRPAASPNAPITRTASRPLWCIAAETVQNVLPRFTTSVAMRTSPGGNGAK